MQALLRAKGLIGARVLHHPEWPYVKDLDKDSDSVFFCRLRVLAVMLGMGVWQGLCLCSLQPRWTGTARVCTLAHPSRPPLRAA